jgi:16S rRNA (cytidine1402-2'-O)-methyltransferase
MPATIYLIPSLLAEDGTDAIPDYILAATKECQIFFTENERTTRRYFKQIWKTRRPGEEIVIDNYQWFTIGPETTAAFRQKIKEGLTIGIVSEAGCPGIADPGQALVAIAQEMGALVKPLVGPSSILLALMASGMNGQQFQFVGYLPVDTQARAKTIRDLETDSARRNCTQVFIETPYRNNQLLEALIQYCKPQSRLCIAANMTGQNESVQTHPIDYWKKNKPELHKQPVIFCLNATAGPLT